MTNPQINHITPIYVLLRHASYPGLTGSAAGADGAAAVVDKGRRWRLARRDRQNVWLLNVGSLVGNGEVAGMTNDNSLPYNVRPPVDS
jgi:hypothetical protein